MLRKLPFWRTRPLCDTSAVYTLKPLLSSHFSVLRQKKFPDALFYRTPGNVYALRDFGVDFFVFYVPDKNTLVHFVTIYSCNAVYSSR